MIKIIISTFLLATITFAKEKITPNEVYAEVRILQEKLHSTHKFYKTDHSHNDDAKEVERINAKINPRNVWHKTYELVVKLNLLRENAGLPKIEPVNMEPRLWHTPFLVYAQVKRLQTEMDIYNLHIGAKDIHFTPKKYTNKKPINVYNALTHVSSSLDELNNKNFSYSYVFGELMRVYEDVTKIVDFLKIEDETIPTKRIDTVKKDTLFIKSLALLKKLSNIQRNLGIPISDFSSLKKKKVTLSSLFNITQMVLAEIQPIKAHIKLTDYITPPAKRYKNKTSVQIDQLIGWIDRKLEIIDSHIKEGGTIK